MPDKRRTLVFFKTLIVSVASSFLFIVLSIILAPIIVEFGLDVIDVIVNLGKWNHAELAKVLHISHQRGQDSQKEGIHGHRTWQLRKNGSRKLTPFQELINLGFLKKGIDLILHNQAGV